MGLKGKAVETPPHPVLSLSSCGMVVLCAAFGDRKGERDAFGWRGWEDELLVKTRWVEGLWVSKRESPGGPGMYG